MTKSELKRLIKIEDRINLIARDELNLEFYPIEFDIIPSQKMLEIMAYHIPTNISNWKFGRDYERQRTIYEHGRAGMPYEVVINSNPAKAYLMNDNRFAVQCLVMAHVFGHCAFFTMNKYYQNSRQDIIGILHEATNRFNEYERRYGIDEVEKTVDAGHALQWHSSPFESRETEDEKRLRVFNQAKKEIHATGGEFGDITGQSKSKKEIKEDIELYNQKLWRSIKLRTPVEPTEDILRYIIDNAYVLEDWQKDILEVTRMEGQYHWPTIKTKFMNEGFAVRVHEKIMNRLFEGGLLTTKEHADYNYSNSLIKATHPFQLNPYYLGAGIWVDIESRWDKGQYGKEWLDCIDEKERDNWDTHKNGAGWEKCLEVIKIYTDWFFMMDFLTPEVVNELGLYIYEMKDAGQTIDFIITKDKAKEIRGKIINAFAQNRLPQIEIVDGNYEDKGWLMLNHKFIGVPLDENYAKQTLKHISYLWGKPVLLQTKQDDENITWQVNPDGYELEEKPSEDSTDDE